MYFRGEYFFLSNMYKCPVRVVVADKVYTFNNAESALQALRSPENVKVLLPMDGLDARRRGRSMVAREDWDSIKDKCLYDVVSAKFLQNLDLLKKLREVKGDIVFNNSWGDTYWGVSDGVGANVLGRILMHIRDSQEVAE